MPLNIETDTDGQVFDIKTPKLYRCNVYRYHSGLSKLYIRVFKGVNETPSFYLFFSDVGYFEGPMNWSSADFQVAPADDCLDLMRDVGLVENMMLEDPDTREALAEAAHLYTVQAAHTVVRIIAGEAVKLEDVPDDMR